MKQQELRNQLPPTSPEVKEIEMEEDEKMKATGELKESDTAVTKQSGTESSSDNKKVMVVELPLSKKEQESSTRIQLIVEEGKEAALEQGTAAAGGSSLSVNDITILAASPEVMESTAVTQVRAELATLVADRQRLEAHRRRLDRKMDELNKQVDEQREVFSSTVYNACGH